MRKNLLNVKAEDLEQIKMLSISVEDTSSTGLESYDILKNAIVAISEDSHEITEFIQEIEKNVFETRILSFNASIEAASAGEQGRGFSVVATEMRVLADSIKNNMSLIEKITSNIVSAVNTTMEIAEDTQEKMEKIEMSTQLVNQFISDLDIDKSQSDY